jgi:Tfp pilus assembly protein PilV
MYRISSNSKGDTIVEVLMSIAIAGAVITGAYAVATRSLQQSITASENTQSLKLAEGQIEALKLRQKIAPKDSTDWTQFLTANDFCLDITATSNRDVSGAVPANWNLKQNTGNYTGSTVNLRRQGAATGYNAICNPSTVDNARYFINIGLSNGTYLVTVRWEAIAGRQQNLTQLYYRAL